MSGYFSEILTGGKSLLVGLGVTFKAMLQPIVTVQYPREKTDVTSSNYRGHIELVRNPETGSFKCIACGLCAKACPSECITVKSEKREGVKGKVLTVFQLDFTKCSLCGSCVESCNKGAIRFSQDYNIAGFTKEEFHYDLLKRLEEMG